MMNASFLSLPHDVLLTILGSLDVKDVIRMGMTCRNIRSLIESRSLWITLLKEADQTCPPNLPPYVDPHSLSAQELRDAVVPAARFYSRCLTGTVTYEHRVSTSLSHLVWEPESAFSSYGSELVKLLHGGRYLYIANSKIAHIIDIQDPQTPMWTRTAQALSRNRSRRAYFWFSHIACEMCPDGSITALLVAKRQDSHDRYFLEVHRLQYLNGIWSSELAYSHDCECRDDDEPVVRGDYVVCPGIAKSSIINWRKGRMFRADTSVNNSVAEPLRVTLWHDYLIFVTRTFFLAAEGRFNFQLNAIYLPPYFSEQSLPDDVVFLDGESIIELSGPNVSSTIIHHPENRTLVQLSTMTITELPHSTTVNQDVASIIIGAKFWEDSDRTRDFFSIYEYTFNPSKPLNRRFSLRTIPLPRLHPLEEENTRIGYTAGVTTFSNAKNGILLHSTYRSLGYDRLRFYLSVLGLDAEGRLYFAQVDEDFREYLALNRNRCRVPIEKHSGALVLLASDTSKVDIWYPA